MSNTSAPIAAPPRPSPSAQGTRPEPAADPRSAFEAALARLAQQRRDAEAQAEAGAVPAPESLPGGALPGPPQAALPLPAASDGPALAAAGRAAATLEPGALSQMLSSLQVPATPDGPQRWDFQFADTSGLPLRGLTLTSEPGQALVLQLHAHPQASPRERELSAQRLGELRQRLGEIGAPVAALDWSADEHGHPHDAPR
jgi:hypothetical protein